jgi:hypothetical protein
MKVLIRNIKLFLMFAIFSEPRFVPILVLHHRWATKSVFLRLSHHILCNIFWARSLFLFSCCKPRVVARCAVAIVEVESRPVAVEFEPPLTPTPAATATRTNYNCCRRSPPLQPPPPLPRTLSVSSRWNYPEGRRGGSFPGRFRGGKTEMRLDSYQAWTKRIDIDGSDRFFDGPMFSGQKTVLRTRTGWNKRGLRVVLLPGAWTKEKN